MNKKFMNNNRGAALVSVMIAIAFIAILASSLLYMTYSNYKMKVVNYESKSNFYGTEHDMVVVSTSIRNGIANATSDPEKDLRELVGVPEKTPSEDPSTLRYNPTALAKLVYTDITVPATETDATLNILEYDETTGKRRVRKDTAADADITVKFSTATAASSPNYIVGVAPEDSTVTMVTLKDVVIEQYDKEGNYVNKIQTDLVYRFKDQPLPTTGGVGEFSVIMDTPMDATTNMPSRVTMYGNVFLGSGSYVYGSDYMDATPDGNNDVIPSSGGTTPALHLSGDTVFTLVGDNMIVYGDIVLEGNSVLNIVSGSLTVLGNIYIKGNGALLTNGTLYFPPGDDPNTTSVPTEAAPNEYGIKLDATASSANLIPSDLISKYVSYLTMENYIGILGALGLRDGNADSSATSNDGVLAQILNKDTTTGTTFYDYAPTQGQKTGNVQSVYGMGYQVTADFQGQTINAGTYGNRLIFLGNYMNDTDTSYGFNDGANLHSTFICQASIKYTNHKPFSFTQLGSEVFNKMIDPAYGFTIAGPDGSQMPVSNLFVADPNTAINNIVNYGTNNAAGTEIFVAVGYDNWVKE